MKKYLPTSCVLFLYLIITACDAQPKIDSLQTLPPPQVVSQSQDSDPYFVASKLTISANGPTSITRSILEDRKGTIWLATWEGIISYDGNNFTNHTNQKDLRHFHVFSILEDSKGMLWFGTIGAGVYRYDGKKFTNFTTKEGLAHDNVLCIYEDKMGRIWLGTEGGMSCYDGSSFRNYSKKDGLTDNEVNSIVEDKNGLFWIGTRGEACQFDGKTFAIIANKNGVGFPNVRSIIEDQKGNIWLGGNSGLWRYDGTAYENLAKDFIGCVFEDKAGNIWTSAAGDHPGQYTLNRYDNLGNTTTIRTEKTMFFGIEEDAKGGIWQGSLNGVCRYDGSAFDCFKSEFGQ